MQLINRRRLSVVALLAAATMTLGACSSDSDSTTEGESVSIAFVGALTGDSANLGINVRNAAKVAIKQANDAGANPKIVLKEFDTQGDPAVASTLKDKFLSDKTVIGVLGPVFSGETKAVLPDLQANNLVAISPSATNVKLPEVVPNETVFHRVIPDDDVQGQGVTDYIVKALKPKKVAYIHDNTEYGKGLAEGTMKTVSAAGVATAVQDAIDPKSQDYSSAVNKVKSSGADVVFYGGYYTQAGKLRKQLVDAGVTAKFLTGDGSLDPGFITAGGAGAEGAQVSCPCNLATADSPGALGQFAKTYKEVNNADPGTYSTEAYDSTNILIAGIKAGNTTRQALLNYVETMAPYQGIGKTIEFLANGNVKATGVYFFEVKNGKLALLGTNDTLIK